MLLTPNSKAPKTVSVYRAGEKNKEKYKGGLAFYSDMADFHKPQIFPKRNGSVYSSVNGKTLARWMKANAMGDSYDVDKWRPYEFKVDPNQTYVFNVSAWDDYSWSGAPPEHFWGSAILLSRFDEAAEAQGWNKDDWEVLLPNEKIIKETPVGLTKLRTLFEESNVEPFVENIIIGDYKKYCKFFRKK